MPLPALSLPSHVERVVWRGLDLGQAQLSVRSSGHALLDAELPGGGWPCQSLIEVLQSQAGLAEWRLLSPVIRPLLAHGASVLLIAPPHMPGLGGLWLEGVAPGQLVWVEARTVAERLWATEQALKAGCLSVVLCWLPQARPEQIRRLHVCAGRHPGLLFVFRPMAAQADPSAAPIRLQLGLGAWPHPLQVQLLKRRGPAMAHPITLPHWPRGLTTLLPRWLTSATPPPTVAPRTTRHPPAAKPHADLDRPDPRRATGLAASTT